MAKLRFSSAAEADLVSITAYTLRTWGDDQTIRYLNQLEETCQILSGNPSLGRGCDHIYPKLRRLECGRHVVFYCQEAEGILILRILHQRMLPKRDDFDEKG